MISLLITFIIFAFFCYIITFAMFVEGEFRGIGGKQMLKWLIPNYPLYHVIRIAIRLLINNIKKEFKNLEEYK